MVTASRVPSGDPIYNEIVDFLIDEAALLNQNRLPEWVELLAEDLSYRMPVRETLSRAGGPGFDPRVGHFDDDLPSIKLRVRRLIETKSAYAEDPPSRSRRFVTNVVVHRTAAAGEYEVTSDLLLTRNRWDAPVFDLLSASREDLLRRTNPGWKLARRTILVDQATLGTPNLAIFL